MELLLVRHAESEGNVASIMQGRLDYPLTERGRGQAARLARWLGAHRVTWDVAYASPQSRAKETANIVTRALGVSDAEDDADLVELDAGRAQGLGREQLEQLVPSFLGRPLLDSAELSPWGGESYAAVQARAERVLARWNQRHESQRLLVVSHGGFLTQLLKRLICVEVPRVAMNRYGNCTVTLVRVAERRGTRVGELIWHVPVELFEPSEEGGSALFA